MYTTFDGEQLQPIKSLKIDDKGRINLSKLVDDRISSFQVFRDREDRIILEPYMAEIPARELWSMRPEMVAKMDASMASYKAGKLVPLDPKLLED